MSNAKPKFPTLDINFPAGRFVLGSLTERQMKDNQGRDRKNPTLFVAVAIDKRTPGIDQIIGNIIGFARHTYQFVNGGQQVQPRLAQPNFAAKSGFAWKIKDGDADPKWAAREGCQGCWIFCFGTSFAPARCCDMNNVQLDANAINLGDYVEIFCSVGINGEVGDTAGLYLNPNGVKLVGYGQRIIPAGQSFEQMFAGRPSTLPPGASPTPIGGPAPSQFTQQPQGGYAPPQQPQQGYGQPPAAQQGYGGQNEGYTPQVAPAGGYEAPQQPGYSPPPQVGGYAPPSPGAQNVMAAQGQPYSPPGGHPAHAPAVPAGAAYTGPAGASYMLPAAAQPATAYPSSPAPQPGTYQQGQPIAYPAPGQPGPYAPPAGVQPNYGFVNGPQR
jgi:hypothetical protein